MNGPKRKVVFRTDRLTVVRVRERTGKRVRTFAEQKGKVTLIKSNDGKVLDDLLNLLPASAWRTKFARLIKAAAQASVRDLTKLAKGPLKTRLNELDDAERIWLVRSVTRTRMGSAGRKGAIDHADGLLREMDFWHEFDSASRTARAKAVHDDIKKRIVDFNKANPNSKAWEEEVRYVRRAYTPGSSPKGLPPGEVGDLIAYTLSKNKKPEQIWIVMIGNAKGTSNAVALASKGGWFKPWSGEIVVGEFLGQADFDLERIPEFGIEIPGVGTFKPDDIKVGPRSTLRIGVVPPDISPSVRNRLDNFAKYKSKEEFRLWDSRISSKDSREAADNLIDIVEST